MKNVLVTLYRKIKSNVSFSNMQVLLGWAATYVSYQFTTDDPFILYTSVALSRVLP
ncbi:hypothetical protein AB6C96_01150 [Vibrio cyclitrophicus]|uniref:hypothetical protein n=1 Tax=Vibrio kanaloae TaxID=170673 RepID=UPI001589E6A8|nr:hypothetical protein [Vibrio kanaloae]QPK06513.1 hypothetical protein BTD91_15225 [Vibrio kanaloae]